MWKLTVIKKVILKPHPAIQALCSGQIPSSAQGTKCCQNWMRNKAYAIINNNQKKNVCVCIQIHEYLGGCSLFTLQNHTQQCSSIIPSRAQGDTMWYEDSSGIHTGQASHLLYLFDPKNFLFYCGRGERVTLSSVHSLLLILRSS